MSKQQRANANFAWPRKHSGFIHHLVPHCMAWFSSAFGLGETQMPSGTTLRRLGSANVMASEFKGEFMRRLKESASSPSLLASQC